MSGRIPRSFIDELLTRIDIVEVVGTRVPLRKAGREFAACCPFHSEKTPSFTVSPTKQFYHCFGCGAHGSAIGFLMEHERLSFPEAVEELAGTVGLEVPYECGAAERPRDDGSYEVMERAQRYFQEVLRHSGAEGQAWTYLKRRGLDQALVGDFGIGYALDSWDDLIRHMERRSVGVEALLQAGLVVRSEQGKTYDRFRDRIMFPIRDRRGRTVAFGGRVLGDAKPKYLNSPETAIFSKGRILYGLYEALAATAKPEQLLVVEGYMDVVALAQFGLRNAVATLGTAATREHLQAAFRVASTLVFCFDGDRAGRGAASRAMENVLPLIQDGRQARFLFLPEGEDPDSLIRREGAAAFSERATTATPLSEFFLRTVSEGIDLSTADGRAQLLERARTKLARVPAGIFLELLMQTLADRTHQPVERVRRQLAEPGGGQAPRPRVAVNRTAVRHGIALLLHRPALASEVELPEDLAAIPEPGATLLAELLEISRSHPHLSGAALVERYRDSEHWEALARLCEWEPEIPEDRLSVELADTLRRLRERHAPRRLLLDKLARDEPLTDAEREALRQNADRRQMN